MKKKALWLAVGLAVGIWNGNLTAAEQSTGTTKEHPQEHPTGTAKEHPTETKKEHPEKAKKEHPKEHPEAKEHKAFQNEYEKVVKDYLSQEAKKSGGVFTIKDEKLGKDWKLQLVRVHKNKICMLQEGKKCFACADFREMGGKAKLDLDFYANKSEDGKISMDKVLIHKVNGKPRFTYDEQNNMVPVKD